MTLKRFCQRAYHLWERIAKEGKALPGRWKAYGPKVALVSFWDGLIPPGKSRRYIDTVGAWVDRFLAPVVEEFQKETDCHGPAALAMTEEDKVTVWCCWWQGEAQMPELVRLCHTRLKQVLPADKARLQLITKDNYRDFADIPEHIIEKFEAGRITMATMSDVLRFALLEKHGGYWLDATLFFTGEIPEEYFSGNFYCQRMVQNTRYSPREACRCNWCGFSMAGPKGSPIFRFMGRAFDYWYRHNDGIIDYVLIDYMLWTGFQYVPAIREIIDAVPDNNEDIFEMYQVLNAPYSPDLYARLTRRNVMHKLTYKMDLQTRTAEGQLTLYGWLKQQVFGEE